MTRIILRRFAQRESCALGSAPIIALMVIASTAFTGCVQMMIAQSVAADQQRYNEDIASKAKAIEALYDPGEHAKYLKGGSGQIIFDLGAAEFADPSFAMFHQPTVAQILVGKAVVYVFPNTKYGQAMPRPPAKPPVDGFGVGYIPDLFFSGSLYPDFKRLTKTVNIINNDVRSITISGLAQSEYSVVVFANLKGRENVVWAEQIVVPSSTSPPHVALDSLTLLPAE